MTSSEALRVTFGIVRCVDAREFRSYFYSSYSDADNGSYVQLLMLSTWFASSAWGLYAGLKPRAGTVTHQAR